MATQAIRNEELVNELKRLVRFGQAQFGYTYVITEGVRDALIDALSKKKRGRPAKICDKGRVPE